MGAILKLLRKPTETPQPSHNPRKMQRLLQMAGTLRFLL